MYLELKGGSYCLILVSTLKENAHLLFSHLNNAFNIKMQILQEHLDFIIDKMSWE